MTRARNLSGAVCVLLTFACVERSLTADPTGDGGGTTTGPLGGGTSSTPTTSGSSTDTSSGGEPPGTTSTGAGTTAPPDTTGDASDASDTCSFICDPTDVPNAIECDLYQQNCPEGEKCAVYAEDEGSSWNAAHCVAVTGDGQPGEPCTTIGGGVSGVDDCQKGAMCWDVDVMGHGTCIALCSGSEAAPICPDNASCAQSEVLNICIPDCDPLLQDCLGDDLCIPVGDTFVCVIDASGEDIGAVFDPCEFVNACDKGLLCLDPTLGAECDPNAGGCCLPFCPLDDPNFPCPGAGQQCISLYDPMPPPEDFANVGICILPP